MISATIENITVIGLGTIGHSVAQVFATAGRQVNCFDPAAEAREALIGRVRSNLEQMVTAGLVEADQIDSIVRRLVVCDCESEALAGAQFVSEAAAEELEVKQELFVRLEQGVERDTILASNTSTYPMTQIAQRMRHRDRALVTHPFNPPHLIPVVEVVPGEETSTATVAAAMTLLEQAGKRPVRLNREMPGFLINRIQVAMVREVWDLLDRGVASASDIDAAVRGTLGFRLAAIGPLEVCDFAGLDIWARVFKNLAAEITSDTELPGSIRTLIDAGNYGTKTGSGFFDYSDSGRLKARTSDRDQGFLKILKLFHSDRRDLTP